MNEQIQQLESQLSEMNPMKRLFVYGVIVLSAIYMSWVLYGESIYEEVESSEATIMSLESKLMKNSNRSLEAAILKSKKAILGFEDSINHLHFQKQFIQTKLQNIDFIYYNEAGSAQILDDILKRSIEEDINLESIQKRPLEKQDKKLIQKKSEILINGEGSLRSITSLHHYIESLNALLSSESLHVEIDENNATHFELRLLHYGVEL
jgi:hypothetical protein